MSQEQEDKAVGRFLNKVIDLLAQEGYTRLIGYGFIFGLCIVALVPISHLETWLSRGFGCVIGLAMAYCLFRMFKELDKSRKEDSESSTTEIDAKQISQEPETKSLPTEPSEPPKAIAPKKAREKSATVAKPKRTRQSTRTATPKPKKRSSDADPS